VSRKWERCGENCVHRAPGIEECLHVTAGLLRGHLGRPADNLGVNQRLACSALRQEGAKRPNQLPGNLHDLVDHTRVGELAVSAPKASRRERGDAGGATDHGQLQGQPAAQRTASEVRPVEAQLVEQPAGVVDQGLLNGPSGGVELWGITVTRQINKDYVTVLRDSTENCSPGLAPMPDPMQQH
jgi:hypothetical protein